MSTLDLTESIAPRSDQANADDFMSGPRTFTIADVRMTGSEDQPFAVYLAEFDAARPYKPSKSMRRVMVAAWGKDGSAYVGRRLTLYTDPEVRFGGTAVGGIRIQAMSHIDKPMKLSLTVTKGKRAPFTVQPLADEPDYVADAQAAQDIAGWRQVWQRAKDAGHLTDALKAKLTPIGEALKAGPQKRAHILPVNPPSDPPGEPAFDEPPAEFQGEAVERGQ